MSHQSPSPSPSPAGQNGTSAATKSARQSLGPAARAPAGLSPLSPRPSASAARPTSELLGAGSFQNPEVEALDQWFENLANYEATLEEMAAASLDVNFKEELSAIEQWFRVLSEAERTAALYSLLQHSTQVQIRFFITVLQQMARSDPMTALLSPSGGGSMQAQMEAKLASMNLKSPGIKAPPSPSGRNFSGSFLAPEGLPASPNPEAAATLAQQRARLKASNADAASRRISAPGTLSNAGDGRNVWQSPQLDQVAEREPSPAPQEQPSPGPASARPKSTDFSVLTSAFKNRPSGSTTGQDVLSPIGNWSSNVNTPLIPMFGNQTDAPNLDGAVSKLSSWSTAKNSSNSTNGRINLADAKAFRRPSKASNAGDSGNVYGDDGNLIGSSPQPSARSTSGNLRAQSNAGGGSGWGGSAVRSPASNVSSNRFGGNINQEELLAAAAAGGMPFNFAGLGMNPMMAGLGGMGGLPGLNMMGMVDPVQANYLAAQIAAGQMGGGMGGIPGMGMPGMAGMAGMGYGMQNGMNNRNARPQNRTNNKSSLNGREPPPLSEEDEMKKLDVLLADVPAWLRSLRLHKYTPNFQGMKWTDMVDLNEQQLEDKGVAALGARRKLLKTFEEVKAKKGMA